MTWMAADSPELSETTISQWTIKHHSYNFLDPLINHHIRHAELGYPLFLLVVHMNYTDLFCGLLEIITPVSRNHQMAKNSSSLMIDDGC